MGTRVWVLAYPFGDPASVTGREWQMAEQAGFERAFMNVGGGFAAALPRFALTRVRVTLEMGLAEFEAHVPGFHNALRERLTVFFASFFSATMRLWYDGRGIS